MAGGRWRGPGEEGEEGGSGKFPRSRGRERGERAREDRSYDGRRDDSIERMTGRERQAPGRHTHAHTSTHLGGP